MRISRAVNKLFKSAQDFSNKVNSLGPVHCSAPGCQAQSDKWSDFIKVLDTPQPGPYCAQHAKFCDICKHPAVIATGAQYTTGAEQSGFMCQNCVSKYRCDECYLPILNEELVRAPNGEQDCPRCYANNWKKCKFCDEIVPAAEIVIDPVGDPICQECFNEDWYSCDCGEIVRKDNVIHEDDKSSKRNRHRVGCSNCFATCESCGLMTKPKDDLTEAPDNNYYCENCFSENWSNCDECNNVYPNDEMNYVEDEGDYCTNCFNETFGVCSRCGEQTKYEEMWSDEDENQYCTPCWEKSYGTTAPEIPEYAGIQVPQTISYNKNDRYLQELKKLLPISIKDLKKARPNLIEPLKQLITFAKGKDLTPEIVSTFEAVIPKEEYSLATTVWKSPLQRSVRAKHPQFVLNLVAGPDLLAQMRQDGSYNLFEKINLTSKKSGHPMVPDQLGWARLELHPEKAYILIDEIQTDHMNAIERITHERDSFSGKTYKQLYLEQTGQSEEGFNQICANLKKHIKEFPDVILKAIGEFARTNGYKELKYHTYESGMKLKNNQPPKSLYTEVPKRHFFEPTQENPFGLEGQFLGREARLKKLQELFKKIS